MIADYALIIDFETRSRCDLKAAGVYNYAEDDSTEMLCLGLRHRDKSAVVKSWLALPHWARDLIADPEVLVVAWNAQFDRLIWEALAPDKLQIPLSRWYCAAAQARVNALPGALGDATKAIFGRNTKDFRGPQLIRLLSVPRKDGTFLEDPKLLEEMAEYCMQDVNATYDVLAATRTMTAKEHRDYLNNEMINDDGICIDGALAHHAVAYAGAETLELAKRLTYVTGGDVTKHTQVKRIKDWVVPRMSTKALELATVHKKGEAKISLDKAVRARLLAADEEQIIPLQPSVREVLQLLDDGNKSSVAKFSTMLSRASRDDMRVRGAFVYAGASQTLRYASRGLQVHNFARDCLDADETDTLIATMKRDEPIASCMQTLSRALRPAIIPERGNLLVVGDWSSIEARALPWLSDSPEAEERLHIFRIGGDVYQHTADRLQQDRQVGKVAELSLGYGGAAGAFKSMAANYHVYLEERTVHQLVGAWRMDNPWAEEFWNELHRQAMRAIAQPGMNFRAGRVVYRFYPELLGGSLQCTLPDGTVIQYPKAKLETRETEYGPRTEITALKANWKPAAGEKEWPRVTLWRGLLAENVTQAICASLLRGAVDNCLYTGLPVIAHVHDEVVLEVPGRGNAPEAARDDLQRIMTEVPPWAEGLPLAATPTIMRRYGK